MRYFLILLVLLSSFSVFAEESKEKDRLAAEKTSKDIFLKKKEQHLIDLIIADMTSRIDNNVCYMIASKTKVIIERNTKSKLNAFYLINGRRKYLKEKGFNNVDEMVDLFISVNKFSYTISLPENINCEKNRYVNDFSCANYSEDRELNSWFKCYKTGQNIRIVQFSVPVLYEKENIVMVYKFESGGSLDAQTTLVLYQLKNNKVNKILEILLSRS